MFTRPIRMIRFQNTRMRRKFLLLASIPMATLLSFAAVQVSYVVVDANSIPNGHKPKVIGDFANTGSAGIGALSAGQGFNLYKYPDWLPHLITSYNNGPGDEDAQAVDINGDGALDIVIGGLDGNTYWLENPLKQGKDPYNSTWQVHQIHSGLPSHDVVVGDINRDGRMDIATESGLYLQGSAPDTWTFVGAPQINRSSEGTTVANLLNDGYLDVIAPYQSGAMLAWFENPMHSGGNPVTDTWRPHVIDSNPGFTGDMATAGADFNRDGRLDIALSPMYRDGFLVWYEAPPDPRDGTWIKHVLGPASFIHQGSLQIGDFDGDGNPDIAFGEQEQSSSKRIGVYFNGGAGSGWTLQVLANTGGHNIKAGITGDDRLPSLLSANHGFYGAPNPVELWRFGGALPLPVVSAAPSSTQAVITWTTGVPSTSQVVYGTTPAYGSSSPQDSTLVTTHSVTLSGLTCSTTYHYQAIWLNSSATGTSPDATFTTTSCGTAGGPVSENFNSTTLNSSLWTFVNPVGDGAVSLNGTQALLGVPAGTPHDVWPPANLAARIMQSIGNVDFQVEAKFDSIPAAFSQMQGIVVEQDSNNYLRMDFYHDGSTPRLFAASIVNNVAAIQGSIPLTGPAASLWLRLTRAGDNWSATWSRDGTTFNNGPSFSQTLVVTKIGPFAANCCGSPSPAFIASVDYFFNTAFPLVP